ncbi:MAG: hypothetical protein SAK29_29470 [Scytonema sp. PMC 1069.18]|nr:hypothetical protein [Scytonema sp. PMC 1069.18]MEC4886044.1 hypothetical protein [Scytonema sp. PMC 1070.18]
MVEPLGLPNFNFGAWVRIVNKIEKKMIKPKNLVYRGHPIEKVGHGKRAVFRTIINEKEWSAITELEVKAAIDTWIDEGVEPSSI